ncbi:MAG: prolyl oligopeptidase family serine peptidase [Planctomycetota bacterium]|nr:prolyl oligopeptidase family serine peptidase [Planctomycetota bacterium]
MRPPFALAALLLLPLTSFADGPADNQPDDVRRIPKLGIELSPDDKITAYLLQRLDALGRKIDEVRDGEDSPTKASLNDIEVLYRAAKTAVDHQEFFAPDELHKAQILVNEADGRLVEGPERWTSKTGLVVRGYRSKIDHSIQPYGLVVPPDYQPGGEMRYRLDVWFHGRGETLSEVNFLHERMNSVGQFAPPDTIVLHPYGRYCNANKFAGEVDVLEAIEDVKKHYPIDEDRISVRGFSMGGAAAWQFATHYSDRWFAANPGAGFAETPRFLNVFQNETLEPTWYEKKLWRLYDCDLYALNLLQCPTVAYSGEIDKQKQAADVMAEALAEHGVPLTHVIGPQTAHKYHPDSAKIVDDKLASLAEVGRERFPPHVRLETYTLKYNRMNWVTLDALGEHWERAAIDAKITDASQLAVTTENVTAMSFEFPSGRSPFAKAHPVSVEIDGQTLDAPATTSDGSWMISLHRDGEAWQVGPLESASLRKRHDLQGPIDDAFMDSFIFVRPTGESPHATFDEWCHAELDRAIEHWRRHFRGDARVKDDTAITDDDVANANLVLWGDPTSNAVLKRIADKLPIAWTNDSITVGEKAFPSDQHALILIQPNPLNPNRYVVLNSSFTFREYAYLNNARQVPMLPDWAVIDLQTKPNSRTPGKVVAADFFDENWKLKPARE